MENRTTVSIATGKNRIEAVRQAFEYLGGIGKWVKPGSRVLLKPNIMSTGGTPMITHIDVLKGLYMLCKDAGAKEVMVGENSVCGLEPRVQFDFIGYTDALKRLGARVVFFDEEEWVYRSRPENLCLKDMHLPKSLVEADLWITVPVAKTHVATVSTLGIKNSHGILADEDKARHHRLRPEFGSSLLDKFIDVLAVAKADLSVMDMFDAMEGQGPGFGDTVEMKLILAGDNVTAVDAVTDYLMGFGNLEPPLPRKAQERGLGIADLKQIDFLGENPNNHRQRFIPAIGGDIPGSDPPGVEVLRGDMCRSGCGMPISYMIDLFKLVLGKDLKELAPITVLCGDNPPPPKDKRFIFVFGDCAIYSTWNYEYRRKPAYIGPWWRRRPAYIDVPGCVPLSLSWIRDFAKLIRGYGPVLSLTSMVEFAETQKYTFAEGVPLEKNPRRWQFDPEFRKKYAKEIEASHQPEYIYKNESCKMSGKGK
ncbi:MAG: DUF362 domain-containing protein [bacterium]|nr:DUF362 domain-containing protein [bacterium]